MTRTPVAAVVSAMGKLRSLVVTKEPDRELTSDDVQEPKTLARMLMRIVRDVAQLERRPCPRRLDFEDIEVNGDGITVYDFPHGFGTRVRWWVTDCEVTDGTLVRDSTTNDETLRLISNSTGTVTVRVEEVGG